MLHISVLCNKTIAVKLGTKFNLNFTTIWIIVGQNKIKGTNGKPFIPNVPEIHSVTYR
jgi:hypothetical protein